MPAIWLSFWVNRYSSIATPLCDRSDLGDHAKAPIGRRFKTEPLQGQLAFVVMSNVLNREKREQIIALGRLGWSLRRIEQATGVRRETVGEYLRGAGIELRRLAGTGGMVRQKRA